MLHKETLAHQIITILERQILAGKFVAGRKMPSTRELAKNFGVSQQVIKSAVATMETRQLVIPRPRDGIYVNPLAIAPKRREYAVLSSGGGAHVEDYLARILIFDDRSIWRDVNFSRRILELNAGGGPLLQYELEKIKELHPDCLLTFTPFQSPEELAPFSKLPFPVMFIGDFAWDSPADAPWHQIVEDTAERAEFAVASAMRCGARDITLIAGALTHRYSRILKTAAAAECAKGNAKFTYVEFTDSDCRTEEDLAEKRRTCARAIRQDGRSDAVILDGFRLLDPFAEVLNGSGILILNDREPCPGTLFIASDYRPFAAAARDRIQQLVDAPETPPERVTLRGHIRRQTLRIESL